MIFKKYELPGGTTIINNIAMPATIQNAIPELCLPKYERKRIGSKMPGRSIIPFSPM